VDDVAKLLASAADGDQNAWNALVERYNSLLWSVARAFRLDTEDASDAVQCTWLKLVEHLDGIADPERLPGWLATTVRRECLQVLRRAKRARTSADSELLADLADPAPPVDHGVLLAERDAALWRAFSTLGEQCQRLLRVLMAASPPAYAEVADALDMPIGSIGPTRQRCLAHLRKAATEETLLRPAMTESEGP
jgi:RNA polymerase sigma factor (sigma-70 family)